MENAEIAHALFRVADLLDIQGANPFRVRAYRTAAQFVETHPTSLERMVAEGRSLLELPGVGKDLDGYIRELVRSGTFSLLEQLESELPPSLLELLRLPGVGPKKVRRLWETLAVTDLDALEQAAREGRLASLRGFGERSQAKILAAIEAHRQEVSRLLLVEADQHAQALRRHLEGAPGLRRLEMAGSQRRRKETVGDLDVLATAEDGSGVMERLLGWSRVAEVVGAGPTRATVLLRSGLQVDLRVVPPRSFGAALAYFTGSKPHNIRLRRRALDRGLRISEYGVFERAEEPEGWVTGAEEADVYRVVGLPWIPPELREDQGEIEAAEAGGLPTLIEASDLRGDLQMHTDWSDGRDSLETMVQAARALGYGYLAITDHGPTLAMTGLDPARVREQWKLIDEVQARYPDIRILRGLEVDILRDGALGLQEEILRELDVVLVAVHSAFELPAPEQTARLIRALRHPDVHILAHPTARILGRRKPIELDLDAVLRCAREQGVAVEIDAQPARLDLTDTQARRAKEVGVPMVISSDAHSADQLRLIRYGVDQARRAWLEAADVLNTLPVGPLLDALTRRRAPVRPPPPGVEPHP